MGLACRVICEGPSEAAALFFRRIFIKELEYLETDKMTILNPLLKDAGAAIVFGTSAPLGGICGDETVLLTADFGSEEAGGVFISGVTYVDKNGNGLYDAGEGAPAAITVRGPDEMTYSLRSGGTGYFSLPLEGLQAGQYDITALMEDGREFSRRVVIGDKSAQVFIGAPSL